MITHQFSSVQAPSRVRLFATPWIAARQAALSITNSQSLLKLMPIKDGDAIQSSHPLLPPSPPTPNPSQHQTQAHPILSILHPVTEILADSIHLSNPNYIPCLQSLSYIV